MKHTILDMQQRLLCMEMNWEKCALLEFNSYNLALHYFANNFLFIQIFTRNEKQLDAILQNYQEIVFARTSPQQKLGNNMHFHPTRGAINFKALLMDLLLIE